MPDLHAGTDRGELTVAQRRWVVRITYAVWLLISWEIAAVVILAGSSPFVAIVVLIVYAEINRRWRPLARVSAPALLALMLAQIVGLATAIVILALA